MSITQDETIASLQQQLATLASQFADLQRSKEEQDLAMETPTLIQTYKPTQDDLERFPFLEPKDPSSVFQQDITDEKLWEQFRQFPKTFIGHMNLPSSLQLFLLKPIKNIMINNFERYKNGTDYWYDRQDQQHAT
ncbi:hypothetical protein BCR41DRAFT_373307 [Lobosporangium transversale]|uniref:Uncharacterized protein n=1 Tax=Lobosporangium transversale TaxID=64571 RepID=A0A1Y2GE35_9FUNG|nr:hypothetical protein BCR41DRAFT_373307 [Lobosporangium transversale]ORZ08274.1 hypothetical protein BCR41DRAFT_373307 [Lobosporangium transversale]|eukprot:XP_021878357.1 hypothetical protein BCR41DRAFT_373307 [Lobosporangium transversale]